MENEWLPQKWEAHLLTNGMLWKMVSTYVEYTQLMFNGLKHAKSLV